MYVWARDALDIAPATKQETKQTEGEQNMIMLMKVYCKGVTEQ